MTIDEAIEDIEIRIRIHLKSLEILREQRRFLKALKWALSIINSCRIKIAKIIDPKVTSVGDEAERIANERH